MRTALATLCVLASSTLAWGNLTVTGTGKVSYVPDRAIIQAGVSSPGKTATEAWDKNREVVRALFEALRKQGIDARDMQTTGLQLTPNYEYPKGGPRRLVGYTASYNLTVKVRDLDRLGKVLDGLVESGANRNVGIRFDSSDLDKLLDQARLRAVQQARKKAELLASSAGAELGDVKAISEGHVPSFRMHELMLPARGETKAGDLPIAAGEQEVSVDVTLTYALERPLTS
jgi:uncharacterized protein YggE